MIDPKLVPTLKQIDLQKYYDFLSEKNLLDDRLLYGAYCYARGYRDFKFFMETFFPQYCTLPFSRMHEEFFHDESDPERRGRREATAAPRSHAKTTIKLKAKVTHAIVYGYEPFVVLMSYSKDHAEAKAQDILDCLSDPRIISVYGNLMDKSKHLPHPARGGKCGFITTNNIRVLPRSRGQAIRGISHGPHRPTLIICDDVEELQESQSQLMRQQVRDWFFKDVLKLVEVNGTSNVIFIGTCLHQESLLSELLDNPGWYRRKYQAIERFSERQDLWDEWTRIYMDLSNPKREADADAFYHQNEVAMLQGSQVLWPEGDSYLKLMKEKVTGGQAAFYSEKQNEPYNPDLQLFKMDQAKYFEVVYDGHTPIAIHWLDGSDKVIPWSHINKIIAFHDPAFSEKPTAKSTRDFAAIVVVAKDEDGYMYALDCYLEKSDPSKQIEAALALHQNWKLDVLYFESNLGQGLLKPLYQTAQEKLQLGRMLRVVGFHQHANKEERINSLEPYITYGQLLFAKNLYPRLIQQLFLFPTGHDDGPDALQGAVDRLRKNIGAEPLGLPVNVPNDRTPPHSFSPRAWYTPEAPQSTSPNAYDLDPADDECINPYDLC